jgi:hypothetical protein
MADENKNEKINRISDYSFLIVYTQLFLNADKNKKILVRKRKSLFLFHKVSKNCEKNFPTNTRYFPEMKTSPRGCMKMYKKQEQTTCERDYPHESFSSKHEAEHESKKKLMLLLSWHSSLIRI